jgi:hypothetical protein
MGVRRDTSTAISDAIQVYFLMRTHLAFLPLACLAGHRNSRSWLRRGTCTTLRTDRRRQYLTGVVGIIHRSVTVNMALEASLSRPGTCGELLQPQRIRLRGRLAQ